MALPWVASVAPFLLGSCLFYPGPRELELLRKERGRPYRTTVFSRTPGEGERPLSQLRDTLSHWTARSHDGLPRWKGILVPEPENLYERLLAVIDGGAARITLVAYRYDAVGLDVLTLVDYLDENGEMIGHDHVAYPEAPDLPGGPGAVGLSGLRWWEYPQLLLELPINLAIGIKEFAGEVVKSPFSLIESGWHGLVFEARNPLSPLSFKRGALGFAEDWRNGWTALTWRFRTHTPHTPLDKLRELLGMVPLVGPVFDHKSPPPDSSGPPSTTLIVLGQGIHCDSETEQMTHAWERAVRERRPGTIVTTSPYRYGGVADVIWSILNISNGMGYDLASHVVFREGIGPGDGVELIGFSGSVQRSIAASHALRHAGITVNRLIGLAGPTAGFSCARENHLLLGDNSILDPIVLTAHAVKTLTPFPDTFRIQEVPAGGGHRTPFLPDGATRAPWLGYARPLFSLLEE